jgi:hypothetical protein
VAPMFNLDDDEAYQVINTAVPLPDVLSRG